MLICTKNDLIKKIFEGRENKFTELYAERKRYIECRFDR